MADEDQTAEDFVRSSAPFATLNLPFDNNFHFLDWFPFQRRQNLPESGQAPSPLDRRKLRWHLYRTGPFLQICRAAHIVSQPYITKALFSLSDPPVKLAKIAIGDGTLLDADLSEELPAVRYFTDIPYKTTCLQIYYFQLHSCK